MKLNHQATQTQKLYVSLLPNFQNEWDEYCPLLTEYKCPYKFPSRACLSRSFPALKLRRWNPILLYPSNFPGIRHWGAHQDTLNSLMPLLYVKRIFCFISFPTSSLVLKKSHLGRWALPVVSSLLAQKPYWFPPKWRLFPSIDTPVRWTPLVSRKLTVNCIRLRVP